jgi:hypothetical protein
LESADSFIEPLTWFSPDIGLRTCHAVTGDSTKMSFVMPSQFTMDNMPVPTDPSVEVTELPPAVYAVSTFSGWAREAEMQTHAAELQKTLEQKGMPLKRDAAGEPVWLQARYDSPWVPEEKRTNEVLMELEHAPPSASL